MPEQAHELRHNTDMADYIEAALRLSARVGIHRTARAMEAAGVPISVIARVLCDTDQRRPTEHVHVH